MPSENTPAILVARFLKANHYEKTLEAFLDETGLSEDVATIKPGDWTVEKLIDEKTTYDATLAFEKRPENADKSWTQPAPSVATELETAEVASNVLCVLGNEKRNVLSITSADRNCKTVSATRPDDQDITYQTTSDSPVLSLCYPFGNLMLSTSMSGKLSLYDIGNHILLDECRNHAKYAVQVVSYISGPLWLVATAAWDQKLIFYTPGLQKVDDIQNTYVHSQFAEPDRWDVLGNPVHTETLPSNPESIVFVRHPDTQDVYLVATRRDSTFLYYYHIVTTHNPGGVPSIRVKSAGRQNLAPHSNAWVAFTPCSLAQCPNDPTLLAVATSQIPHQKVIIVRLLFPDTSLEATAPETIAAMARADLALQDREDAAISLQVSTMAPQTPYSTPIVVWRPDGSGLWVNGDDGVIRGVESKTGKVVKHLKAHESASKVRTLWAGRLKYNSHNEQEVLVSGGFDRKVFIWEVEEHLEE